MKIAIPLLVISSAILLALAALTDSCAPNILFWFGSGLTGASIALLFKS